MVQFSPLDDEFLYLTYALILPLSLLMVSELPMFSLKIKSLQLKANIQRLLSFVIGGINRYLKSAALLVYPLLL